MALDDSLLGPHLLSAAVYQWKKQHEQAIAEAQRALALDPNDADSYVVLGGSLMLAGRLEEAIGLTEKAMRLHPHYPIVYVHNLAIAYSLAGRYEEAITADKRVLTRSPNFAPAYMGLAIRYAELGREAEARAAAAELLRLDPNFSLEHFKQVAPFKDPVVVERHLAALCKAGLK